MSTQKSRLSSGDSLYEYLKLVEETGKKTKDLAKGPERLQAEIARATAQTANDVGSITPVAPTLRSNIEQGVASAQGMFGLGDERSNLRRAQDLTMLGDFLPGTGTGLAVADFEDARQEGNKTGMALAGLGALPLVGKGLKAGAQSVVNLINDTALNMPTNVRGGMFGDLLDKFPKIQEKMGINTSKTVPTPRGEKGPGIPYYTPGLTPVSVAGEGLSALGRTLKEKMSPEAIAFERQIGMPREKAREIAAGAEGASETAELMMRQMGRDTAPLRVLSEKTYLQQGIPASDTADLAEAVGNRFVRSNNPNQIPDKTAERFAKHVQAQVDGTGTVSIKNPAAKGSQEAAGQAKVAPNAMTALQGRVRNEYLTALNRGRPNKATSLSPKETVEFLQVSGAIDVDVFRKYFSKDYQAASDVINVLLKARHKAATGAKLGKSERRVLELFEKVPVKKATGQRVATVRDDAGNILSNDTIANIGEVPEGSFLTTQQYFKSAQKELGGANAFISVDPVKQRAYVGISDKHDIGGLNPVGGENIITAQPLVSVDYATGTYGKTAGLADPSTFKGNNQQLKAYAKELEGVTGVKKRPSETPRSYFRRAIDETEIEVLPEDIAKAKQRAAKVGVTVGGTGAVVGGMLTGGGDE